MKKIAYITVVSYSTVEVDIEEMVREVGPKARTKTWLIEHAKGQIVADVYHTEAESIEYEYAEPVKKIRKGIGSY